MAGLDALTEFRAVGIPFGMGVTIEIGRGVGDVAGGLGTKFLGGTVGSLAAALAQLVLAWGMRRPAVDRFVGLATADIIAGSLAAAALESVVGVRRMVGGLLAQVTGTVSTATGAIGQAPRSTVTAPRQFRNDLARKAALTRL